MVFRLKALKTASWGEACLQKSGTVSACQAGLLIAAARPLSLLICSETRCQAGGTETLCGCAQTQNVSYGREKTGLRVSKFQDTASSLLERARGQFLLPCWQSSALPLAGEPRDQDAAGSVWAPSGPGAEQEGNRVQGAGHGAALSRAVLRGSCTSAPYLP